MGTLKQAVDRVAAAKTAIGNAITAKGGTVAAGDGLEEFATDIATIPSGGGGGSTGKSDVNFYDYDGTIVASYTASDFAELTAMPDNPTHEGLTAQGWNWSLSDAKGYVATYGKLNVGQMYITSDGKTRLYIELTEGRLTPYLTLNVFANSELDIDWGDGSAHSTIAPTTSTDTYVNEMHTYASTGSYVIAIAVVRGKFRLISSSSSISILLTNNDFSGTVYSPDRGYLASIKKVEIGSGIESIGNNAFRVCCALRSITIPDSVTSIGDTAFRGCNSLLPVTIPSSVTSIGTGAFGYCTSLWTVTIPNSVTSIGNSVFQNCYVLSSITIPDSVTSIEYSTFVEDNSLRSITIPDSVTSIGNTAFSNCNTLTSITIPSSVTSIGTEAFKWCYSLATITINKPSGSISGSPWRAETSIPTYTQIVWTG